nr:PREDICTED: tumor necrosis factor receptor superfamily member 9-like [Lepisosteus oculatus]XP_015192595.1 PREDICTED: tumor necrosis factor receptor superfamily member 9-like [Lepisosteus oculatus]XP_015192596.1 PREDICTED: tumor necrosis factor receptor superfamily member 9-like [Lepisosteus oculatus]XP_015192597.1 PREDICTED: tumor necrosis factor receptor superfamily member 9-like [Lepisosteus oculatus]XP_015192598.1 PREDICTED: tumor necrosis factor receptor superfamily member 9-like [Lepisos
MRSSDMGVTWGLLLHLLAAVVLLTRGRAEDVGCKKWTPSEKDQGQVCCEECHRGHHLSYLKCGREPKNLCLPCEKNTYAPSSSCNFCLKCSTCTGKQQVKENCTADKNTVCTCVEGYRCGDEHCSYCVKECGKGEEPVKRTCQPCPHGTFNDQMHRECRKWSQSCNNSQVIVQEGTDKTDIVCGPPPVTVMSTASPSIITLPSIPRPDGTERLAALIAAMCLGLGAFIMVTICILANRRKGSKEPLPESSQRAVREEEDCCSCHGPQQEQGSSMESVDSETKLV